MLFYIVPWYLQVASYIPAVRVCARHLRYDVTLKQTAQRSRLSAFSELATQHRHQLACLVTGLSKASVLAAHAVAIRMQVLSKEKDHNSFPSIVEPTPGAPFQTQILQLIWGAAFTLKLKLVPGLCKIMFRRVNSDFLSKVPILCRALCHISLPG